MTKAEVVARLSDAAKADAHVRAVVGLLRTGDTLGTDVAEVLVSLVVGLAMTKADLNVKLGRALGPDTEKWMGSERE